MPPNVLYRTMREQIAENIRADVLTGELPAGSRLREQELASRYGVSRGPVRDALLQLTQEGILEAKPNCGVTVGQGPGDAVRPLVASMRRRIEIFALKRLMARLPDLDLSPIADTVERLRDGCERSDVGAVARCDMEFHRFIVEAADSRDVLAMWLPVVSRMMLQYTRHGDWMECFREHAAILDAIRLGDEHAAITALESNIQ